MSGTCSFFLYCGLIITRAKKVFLKIEACEKSVLCHLKTSGAHIAMEAYALLRALSIHPLTQIHSHAFSNVVYEQQCAILENSGQSFYIIF